MRGYTIPLSRLEETNVRLAKYNFADNCVPKCNLGTRKEGTRELQFAVVHHHLDGSLSSVSSESSVVRKGPDLTTEDSEDTEESSDLV